MRLLLFIRLSYLYTYNAATLSIPKGKLKLNGFSSDETLPATTKEPFGNMIESQGVLFISHLKIFCQVDFLHCLYRRYIHRKLVLLFAFRPAKFVHMDTDSRQNNPSFQLH